MKALVLELVEGGFQERTAELASGGAAAVTRITSFGQDPRGELYVVNSGGTVWKIVPQ